LPAGFFTKSPKKQLLLIACIASVKINGYMAEVIPAEFARICGVAPSVISRKITNKTLIRNAAGMIDTENPVNSRYANKRRLKSNNKALDSVDATEEKKPIPAPVDFTHLTDHEISEYAGLPQRLLGLTLRELVIRFKGMPGMQEYVKMLKDLTAADERDQKVRERRLQLIEKDFVISHLIQFLDALMRQLFEYPKSAVDEIIALVQAQGEAAKVDVTQKMEAGISKIIKNSKEELIKTLSGLRAKYQDGDGLDQKIREAVAEVMEDD
jgi:hypothetical protein